MNAEDIRSLNDLKMYENLSTRREIVKVNERLKKMAEKGASPIRRHLLSRSVRLSPTMSPSIHEMANHCIEKLGVELPLELFVYSSSQFNAACFKPEGERLYVMFSSSLLEGFTEKELMFVMGHELGHHVYGHHDIPIGALMNGEERPSPKLALELFAWSRYAEISADRAGAHCAQDFDSVASALFKLASGLTGDLVNFDLEEFINQVDEMQVTQNDLKHQETEANSDWFSTHPFSPLRVKALQLFEKSVLSTRGVLSAEDLEVGVQGLMGLMEPSYLLAKTDNAELMRRLLFSAALAVAKASGGISDSELEVFEEFFGKGYFSESINVDKVIDSLEERANAVKESASMARRMQLLRDLCLVAKADNRATKKEKAIIAKVSQLLGVSEFFYKSVLEEIVELD